MSKDHANTGELAELSFLANPPDVNEDDDGDTGVLFPRSDAEDTSNGARFIPSPVTMVRRGGQKVTFVTECGPNCWYWAMPDGSRIYHYDPATYHMIGTTNGRKAMKGHYSDPQYEDGPGPCPHCGNVNTSGGVIK